MTSTKKLNMVFTRGTTTKTFSLANPREDLTGPEVNGFMQDVLDKKVFKYTEEGAAQLDGIKRAYLRETTITELPEA